MIEDMADNSPAPSLPRRALRRALKPVWYRFFRHHPYHYLGALLWRLMPGNDQERMQRVFEQSGRRPLPIRTLALLHYLDNWYYATYAGAAALPAPNRLRWGGRLGVQSHLEAWQNYSRQPGAFERDYASLLARVQELLQRGPCESVVEIGCGNGMLIEWVASRAASGATVFAGVDMNAEIIGLNRERFPGSAVHYEHANSLQAFLAPRCPRSALILAVGAFELFTEAELRNLFGWLTAHIARGALVVQDFTFAEATRQEHSRPGGSFTFFHNYEVLFAQAGLRDIRSSVESDREPHWKTVLVSGVWGDE